MLTLPTRMLACSPMQGAIDIKGVSFSYPARTDVTVFEDLNLHVPAGQTVALVGASGSGKSTVIQLLQRFYDPAAGTISVDGINIRSLSLEWYRNNVRLPPPTPLSLPEPSPARVSEGCSVARRAASGCVLRLGRGRAGVAVECRWGW